MRVLTLARDLSHAHGEAVNLLQLLEALHRAGHHIDVVRQESRYFETDDAVASRVMAVGDRVWTVGHTDHSVFWTPPPWMRPWVDRAPGRLRRLLGILDDSVRTVPSVVSSVLRAGRTRPDVVLEVRQFGTTWSGPVARLTGAALVCQVNVIIDARPRRDKILLHPADRVVAVSRFVADELVRLGIVPRHRVRVVHNGVDPSAYPYADGPVRADAVARLGLDPALPVVLYYGQLNPVKGVDVLLDAAALSVRPYQLVVAGRYTDAGYEDTLEPRFAALAGGPVRVVRLGHHEDVVPLLHAADVVVLPSSREEAFGRVIIEAMSTGRPVVASRIGGIPEVMDGGFEDLLFTPRDPADLARVLGSVLGWRADDPTLGVRSRAHVEERFTLDDAARGMAAVLAEAAVERAGRRPGWRARRRRAGADTRVNPTLHPVQTSDPAV
ncbi:glycosyltransferase family 4 protein [Isoptericola sp. NPDC019482]|uniref:glycosyltransferase family 4 protein n=1 Tax=Isoptericola sp. NPDC019482 TaxID=3154688 RepID=UPI003484F7AF